MTINYHPSDETLLSQASGTLPAGTRIVVAAHIEGCRACARAVGFFEAIGGALLADAADAPLSADCMAQTVARIDAADELATRKRAILASPMRPDGIVLPRALEACDIGRWRWIGPGIRMSRVTVPDAPDANVILLRVAPNRPLPEHGHTGTEFTQVLTGTLIDGSMRMVPGDIMEADADLQHQPVAGPECDCICLAAVEGKLKIAGLIGRAVLSFVGL